jgi:hypothetical protein
MNWQVEFRPEVEQDMAEAAAWCKTSFENTCLAGG